MALVTARFTATQQRQRSPQSQCLVLVVARADEATRVLVVFVICALRVQSASRRQIVTPGLGLSTSIILIIIIIIIIIIFIIFIILRLRLRHIFLAASLLPGAPARALTRRLDRAH